MEKPSLWLVAIHCPTAAERCNCSYEHKEQLSRKVHLKPASFITQRASQMPLRSHTSRAPRKAMPQQLVFRDMHPLAIGVPFSHPR